MGELEEKIAQMEAIANEFGTSLDSTKQELEKLKQLRQPTMPELFISLSEIHSLANYEGKEYSLEVKDNGTYAPNGDNFSMKFGKVVKISHSVYLDDNQKNIISQYLKGLGSFDSLQFILV